MEMIEQLQHRIHWLLINPDTGKQNAYQLKWAESEPEKGNCDFTGLTRSMKEAQAAGRCLLLRIDPEPPAWSKSPAGDYIDFIKEVGRQCAGNPVLYSVDVVPPCKCSSAEEEDLLRIADAYADSFPDVYKLLDIGCEPIALYMRNREKTGLVLDASKGSMQIGAQMEKLGLQKLWEAAPIRMTADELNPDLMEDAKRWHVSSIDTPAAPEDAAFAVLGSRIEVRHVSAAPHTSLGSLLPVSAWIINSGNAPCYHDAVFYLRLSRSDMECDLIWDTGFTAGCCYPGEDRSLQTELPVHDLPEGKYTLQIGLFDRKTGYPITLGIGGRISDGFYSTFMDITVE